MEKKYERIKILSDKKNNLNDFFGEVHSIYGHRIKNLDTNVLLFCIFSEKLFNGLNTSFEIDWKYDREKNEFIVISKNDDKIIQKFKKNEWKRLFQEYSVFLNIDSMILSFSSQFNNTGIQALLYLFDYSEIEYDLNKNKMNKILNKIKKEKLEEDFDIEIDENLK